jgi:ABC-type lipoprotein export system ATPase subunit
MTMLVVTHDPRVREFADRVIDMEDGGVKRLIRRIRREASFVATRHALKVAGRR